MSPDAQDAFDSLKLKFTTSTVLIYPNRELPFIVETDSSNFAIGAVLSQKSPNNNHLYPVAFFSRSLTGAERNYPIYDKELLAIVSALENWGHLLKGSDIPFIIFSDHRNLLFQKKPEKMTQRLVRWSLFLSEFSFKILYRSGSSNVNLMLFPAVLIMLTLLMMQIFPLPSFVQKIFVLLFVQSLLIILTGYKSDSFYQDYVLILIIKNHLSPIAKLTNFSLTMAFFFSIAVFMFHQAAVHKLWKYAMILLLQVITVLKKTISLTFRDFWWPSLSSDIKKYVRSCDICCLSKTSRYKPYGFLNPLEISERPWSSISMDFITNLPDSDGFTCILVIVDRLTKMFHLILFHGLPSAIGTAFAFIDHIFRLHGLPEEIISNRGSQLTS